MRVLYSNRKVGLHDIDHMWCKLYLLMSRYRGTRAYSHPEPWRSPCYPPKSKDVITEENNPGLARIFKQSITVFETACNNGGLDALKPPFTMFARSEKAGKKVTQEEMDEMKKQRKKRKKG